MQAGHQLRDCSSDGAMWTAQRAELASHLPQGLSYSQARMSRWRSSCATSGAVALSLSVRLSGAASAESPSAPVNA